MAQGSLFGRGGRGGDEPPRPAEDEGVRLIGADEVADAVERTETSRRRARGGAPARPGDADDDGGPGRPALRFPLADSEDPSAIERPRPVPLPASPGTDLPHWTEPPTGEVPSVVSAGNDDVLSPSTGPRWRDEHDDWDEVDDFSDLDDGPRLGALAPPPARPTHEEYLSFDDLDEPVESDAGDLAEPVRPRPAAAPTVKKIQTKVPRPAAPVGAAAGPVTGSTPTLGDGDEPRKKPARRANGPVDPGVVLPEEPVAERDLKTAVSVGISIGVTAMVLFWAAATFDAAAIVALLCLGVVVLCALEFFNALQRAGRHPATLLGWVACGGAVLAGCWRGDGGLAVVMAVSVAFAFAWYLLDISPGSMLEGLGATLVGVGWIGLFGGYAGAILHVPEVGVGVLFLTVWVVAWSDIGGYLIGRQIGRTPLSEASPNKTREGLLAGVGLATVLGTLIATQVEPFEGSFLSGLVFCAVVATAAPVGDLFESRLKRDLGLKDMGTLIPGHGGVLDRFDALLLALPVAYYLLPVLGLT